MDNAFQELDYSDISAKHLKKKRRNDEINTRTRGGIIRLCSLIIIIIIGLYLIFSIYSKNKALNKKKDELQILKDSKIIKERFKKLEDERHNFLISEISDSNNNKEQLINQKNGFEETLKKLEESIKQEIIDRDNTKQAVSALEIKLKEYESYKYKIEELQKNVEDFQKKIEAIKNELIKLN